MWKKFGLGALSLMFFIVLAVGIMLLTDLGFNKKQTFFERNTAKMERVVKGEANE